MNAGMLFLALGCFAAAGAPALLVRAVSTALTPLVAETSELDAALGSIARFVPLFGIMTIIALGLFVIRRRLPSEADADGRVATWGCGYAFPRATMQYTGSSYAWKVIHSFRHVIRAKRQAPSIVGCFPSQNLLQTTTTDLAHERIYKPFFSGMARLFERLWPLQHGRIQLYLVYMVATVLIVFLVEGWSGSFLARSNEIVTRSEPKMQNHNIDSGPVVTGGSHRD
jgi:hypothetical protein